MSQDYSAPMPQKLDQSRRTTSTIGHQVADTRRRGNAPSIKTGIVDQHGKSVDGMTLQPGPTNSPTLPSEQNGFQGETLPADPEDAQSQQTTAPPIAAETEPAEVPETTAKPSSGGESDPIIEGENAPTGGLEEARYPSLIPSATPVGYPSD
jgi:hypothetical protein